VRRSLLSLVLAGALVLAACGSSSGTVDEDPTTSSTSTTVKPRVAGINPVHFDPTQATAEDRRVTVVFWGGIAPCFVFDHATVKETNTTVTITLYAGYDASKPHAVCAQIAKQYETTVLLKAPFDGRTLRSGA
jgi:hypothetical protein